MRRGEWKGFALDLMLGTELQGKQLGIIGFGCIGRGVAARASAFGVRVAYASRRQREVVRAAPTDPVEMSLESVVEYL